MEELDDALPKEVRSITAWRCDKLKGNHELWHSNCPFFILFSPFPPIQDDDLDLESFGKKKKKKKRAGEGMAIDDAADDNKENGRNHSRSFVYVVEIG